jgi:hypothetical protein
MRKQEVSHLQRGEEAMTWVVPGNMDCGGSCKSSACSKCCCAAALEIEMD